MTYEYLKFWKERGKRPADKWSLDKGALVQRILYALKFNTVLEFGCGNGEFTKILYSFPLEEYTGVDISKERLGLLEDNLQTLEIKYNLYNEKVQDFKSEKKYDLVCCSHFLLHQKPEDIKYMLGKMIFLSNRYIVFIEPIKGRIKGEWQFYNFEHDYIKILDELGYYADWFEVEENVALYNVLKKGKILL